MRKITTLTIAFFFTVAAIALFKSNLINSIYVSSACRKIYIPVLFWLSVFTYSLAISIACFGRSRTLRFMLQKTVILGFSLHIYLLLIDLITLLACDHSFLSNIYFYYIKALLVILTLIISLAACRLIYRIELTEANRDDAMGSLYFFLPLFLIPVFLPIIEIMPVDKTLSLVILLVYVIPYIFIWIPKIPVLIGKISESKRILKHDRYFIALVFLIAFVVRCIFAVNIIGKTDTGNTGFFTTASDDGDVFDYRAMALVENGFNLKKVDTHIWGGRWDDAYAIVLAAIYKVFGRNFYIVCFIQALLGSLLPVFLFLLGKIMFSRETGVVAGLAASLKGPLIFLSVVLGHEAIWLPLLVLFILVLTKVYKGFSYINAVWVGFILGLIVIFRGLFIYFIPVLFLWMILFWRNRLPITERVKLIIIMGSLVFLIIYSVSAITGSDFSLGERGRIQTQWETERLYEPFKGIGNERLTSIGVDFAKDIHGSVRNMFMNPIPLLKIAFHIYPLRMIAYLEAYQFGFFDPIYLINSANWPNYFMSNLEFYFTLFFIMGLIICFMKKELITSPVFMILTFHLIIYGVVFCNMAPRYKEASAPFVYLIGSFGLTEILKYLKILKDIS